MIIKRLKSFESYSARFKLIKFLERLEVVKPLKAPLRATGGMNPILRMKK